MYPGGRGEAQGPRQVRYPFAGGVGFRDDDDVFDVLLTGPFHDCWPIGVELRVAQMAVGVDEQCLSRRRL